MSSEQIKFLEDDEATHAKEGCLYYANHKGLVPWVDPKTGESGYYYSDGSGSIENFVKIQPEEITEHNDGTVSIDSADLVIEQNVIVKEP